MIYLCNYKNDLVVLSIGTNNQYLSVDKITKLIIL